MEGKRKKKKEELHSLEITLNDPRQALFKIKG